MLDQTAQQELFRRHYGGSDRAAPSLNRPQYVVANSLDKAHDLGDRTALDFIAAGTLGSQVGSSTVFFKVRTTAVSRLGLFNLHANPYENKYIALGMLGADRKPLPLGDAGFALSPSPLPKPSLLPQGIDRQALFFPPGEFYFVIRCSAFAAIPYEVLLLIEPQGVLQGVALGTLNPTARIALGKLSGVALGADSSYGEFYPSGLVRSLEGSTLETSLNQLTIFVPRGVAVQQNLSRGRLQANYKATGVAQGADLSRGTVAPVRRLTGSSGGTSSNLGELVIPLGGFGL
jgi:hypothetical protein